MRERVACDSFLSIFLKKFHHSLYGLAAFFQKRIEDAECMGQFCLFGKILQPVGNLVFRQHFYKIQGIPLQIVILAGNQVAGRQRSDHTRILRVCIRCKGVFL